ncbi:penicillin-binding protein PBP1B [Streptococcus pantholopis]|uniref:Transglycosylase n=1 Tax=Streptococcus pantholopis TaxID=1811193 RepID=A0A172Q9Z8_9STRE|nr:penicillin-binding protein PBP1B [Streptococcus pantholopis]AND80333.1 transglycosylase [Streptococcus pantholopis]
MFKWKNKNRKQNLSFWDFGSVSLRTLKLMSDFFYVMILLFVMLGAGLALGYLASQIDSVKVPSKASLVSQVESLTMISKMNYADGSSISEIDTDLLRTPVAEEAISDNIKEAVIATEDENFASHNGVVPKAVFRATLASVLGLGETSGGSTLTQQLLKQQVLGDDPTFKRKSREIIYALALERYLSKDEILTDYLNVSPFGRNNRGENIAGVEEAAQGIFGVSAKDLTIPQAAYLAGLPQSPIVYSPYTADGRFKSDEDIAYGLQRQENVLYNMYRTGVLTAEEYTSYKDYDIRQDFIEPVAAETAEHDYLYYAVMEEAQEAMYAYLIERDEVSKQDLKNDETKLAYRKKALEELQQGGYTVKTTINKKVYDAMQAAVSQYGGVLDQESSQRVEVGNVLMDNKTGAILGFIGGRDYAQNQNNHAFDTARSPGSSIKPIIAYGPAIDQGLLGSASMLSNYPTTFSSGEKIMHGTDEGTAMINLQEALNTSWNIPAYWTYKLLRDQGVDVESYMTKLGYDIADYSIESLPLGGGIETTVEQQVNAYQMIANRGVYQEGYMVESITDSEGKTIYEHKENPVRVFSAATATILNQLLREPITSGGTTKFYEDLKGLNENAGTADWTGKTGTTDNYSDVWLVVSTPTATLGGWAGNDDNASLSSSSGYNYNAQYMAYLVDAIHDADPGVFSVSEKFGLDDSVVKSTVLKSTGLQAGAVSVNGRNITVGGETTTSYWAKNGAGSMTYKFAIGGTDSDYQKAWAALGGGS